MDDKRQDYFNESAVKDEMTPDEVAAAMSRAQRDVIEYLSEHGSQVTAFQFMALADNGHPDDEDVVHFGFGRASGCVRLFQAVATISRDVGSMMLEGLRRAATTIMQEELFNGLMGSRGKNDRPL